MNRVAQITSSRHFCFFLRLYHTLYQNLLDKNNDNLFPRLFPFSFKLHDSTKFIKIVHHEINPLSILFQNLLNESNFSLFLPLSNAVHKFIKIVYQEILASNEILFQSSSKIYQTRITTVPQDFFLFFSQTFFAKFIKIIHYKNLSNDQLPNFTLRRNQNLLDNFFLPLSKFAQRSCTVKFQPPTLSH